MLNFETLLLIFIFNHLIIKFMCFNATKQSLASCKLIDEIRALIFIPQALRNPSILRFRLYSGNMWRPQFGALIEDGDGLVGFIQFFFWGF